MPSPHGPGPSVPPARPRTRPRLPGHGQARRALGLLLAFSCLSALPAGAARAADGAHVEEAPPGPGVAEARVVETTLPRRGTRVFRLASGDRLTLTEDPLAVTLDHAGREDHANPPTTLTPGEPGPVTGAASELEFMLFVPASNPDANPPHVIVFNGPVTLNALWFTPAGDRPPLEPDETAPDPTTQPNAPADDPTQERRPARPAPSDPGTPPRPRDAHPDATEPTETGAGVFLTGAWSVGLATLTAVIALRHRARRRTTPPT
ncbi:hypothetical protein ACN20G_26605 (plasmid) [Streptomyces sp. BI20]|uniref:hypothetical protein n=1 Tax=Streptomyces sp. BI20 TaxID=3403460 RepID=UPI003C746D23